jgi:[protein-PII] uridylyltransferase
MDVQLRNELLLQLFREAILSDDTPPKPLTPQFQVRDGSLEAVSEDLFARQPSSLLELFALLEQHPELRAVRAGTIRAVGRNLWLIDEEFRQNPRNHRLFLEILRAPRGVTHELRRMNNYGVLGRYIPAFGRVVGRMQYDLFHAYTVDAHTLFVVSNARRLAIPEFNQELPLVSPIMQQLPKQEIVYLGALFHDLAKGRGGDHSELGAVDAEAFCLEQGLSRYEARLVAWLVKHHLLFSMTAQKQDIGDPQVINEFARKIGDENHLDYLYVLTCADVRGTNPKLWNSWKAMLFHDLYEKTRRALRRGLESPVDKEELVRENQAGARALLEQSGVAPGDIDAAWARPRKPTSCATRPPRSRGTPGSGQPRQQRRRGPRRRRGAAGQRHDRGADLRTAPPPQFCAGHRSARSAGSQHRRCAHHAGRERLFPRYLSRPRGGRHDDCRGSAARRDPGRALGVAPASRRGATFGHPPRDAPAACLQDPDADHDQRR